MPVNHIIFRLTQKPNFNRPMPNKTRPKVLLAEAFISRCGNSIGSARFRPFGFTKFAFAPAERERLPNLHPDDTRAPHRNEWPPKHFLCLFLVKCQKGSDHSNFKEKGRLILLDSLVHVQDCNVALPRTDPDFTLTEKKTNRFENLRNMTF